MKKKYWIILLIIVLGISGIFFYKSRVKNSKIGNNKTSQEIVDNILNISSYEVNITVNVTSNKNSNKYILKQTYQEPNKSTQEVIEPSNIAGVKIENDGTSTKIENSQLDLSTILDNYNYLGILDNDIIVGKENIYYKVSDNDLEEIEYTAPLSTFNFNIGNYKTIPSRRFGRLDETKVSNKKISLLKYDKDKVDGISIEQDNERIKITNDNDQKVYVILDKFLDKRVYEVGYIKYINTISLRGKYTVYFKVGNKLYKTNSYVEG